MNANPIILNDWLNVVLEGSRNYQQSLCFGFLSKGFPMIQNNGNLSHSYSYLSMNNELSCHVTNFTFSNTPIFPAVILCRIFSHSILGFPSQLQMSCRILQIICRILKNQKNAQGWGLTSLKGFQIASWAKMNKNIRSNKQTVKNSVCQELPKKFQSPTP